MKTIYGVIWIDNALGPLTLQSDSKESAIQSSNAMRIKGANLISECYAVEVTPANNLIRLY